MPPNLDLHSKPMYRKQLFAFLFFIHLIACVRSYALPVLKDSLQKENLFQKDYDAISNIRRKDTLYINALLELANKERFYNVDSLYTLSKTSLALSQEYYYLKGEINSLLNLGNYYSDQGNISQSLVHLKNAYELAKNNNQLKLTAEVLNILSTQYSYQDNYSQALKGYLDGLEEAKSKNQKKLLSIINENIAHLYLSQKDYKQGMVLLKKAKSINEELGDPIAMAETTSNIASAYAEMNQLDYAMFNINNSISTFEKEKIFDWLAYCYKIKGKVYLKKQKYEWALYWYKQSELIYKKINDQREEISLYNGMAEAYLKLRKDSISEKYATNAFKLSNKINHKIGKQESSNLLYQLYKRKDDFKKALSYHETYQATFDSLSKKDNKKALNLLITKMQYDQQKQDLITSNEKAIAKQKIYIYVSVIVLVIFFVLMLVIKRSERIQKKLNVELLSKQTDLEKKEKYLNELNQTKNKLFSIIGHDLRGPIGAFKELLSLFKQNEMSNEEFLNFVPKLKVDIDNISFTLNNLLSWGQTQMNGTKTKPVKTSLTKLVEDNIGLLSEIAFSKSITVINKISDDTIVWADINQVDILIRNLLSNALKFTPEKGEIEIGATEKSKKWEIYVKDNGLGMTEETMVKIFKKDANHTTYGTNDEKGTGLGLSLCLEMVEKNNGNMWVNSALGKGSTFYFTIPKITQASFKKSA